MTKNQNLDQKMGDEGQIPYEWLQSFLDYSGTGMGQNGLTSNLRQDTIQPWFHTFYAAQATQDPIQSDVLYLATALTIDCMLQEYGTGGIESNGDGRIGISSLYEDLRDYCLDQIDYISKPEE